MAEEEKNFRDYIRHSTGPNRRDEHTKYPVGTGSGPNRVKNPLRPDNYSIKKERVDPIKKAKGLPIEES